MDEPEQHERHSMVATGKDTPNISVIAQGNVCRNSCSMPVAVSRKGKNVMMIAARCGNNKTTSMTTATML